MRAGGRRAAGGTQAVGARTRAVAASARPHIRRQCPGRPAWAAPAPPRNTWARPPPPCRTRWSLGHRRS